MCENVLIRIIFLSLEAMLSKSSSARTLLLVFLFIPLFRGSLCLPSFFHSTDDILSISREIVSRCDFAEPHMLTLCSHGKFVSIVSTDSRILVLRITNQEVDNTEKVKCVSASL